MRFFKAILMFLFAGVLWLTAWLVPAYLRAIDAEVVVLAGQNTTTVAERGLGLIKLAQCGPATFLSELATGNDMPRAAVLAGAVEGYERQNPDLVPWGGYDPFVQQIFIREGQLNYQGASNALQTMLPRASRVVLHQVMAESRRPGVQQILKNRDLTKTVHIPPVRSASGQPLDAAILMAALLHQSDVLPGSLRDELEIAATAANLGQGTQKVELFYLDLLSMARRLNWVQMTTLIRRLHSFDEVEQCVNLLTKSKDQLPGFYSAMMMAASPAAVMDYLQEHGFESLPSLEFAMGQGSGGLDLILNRNLQVNRVPMRDRLVGLPVLDTMFFGFLGMTVRMPMATVYFKYFFMLIGGFLFAGGISFLLPRPSDIERSLQLKNFGLARQSVVAVFLVMVILVAGEPYLFDDNQPEAPMPRWKFPMANPAMVAQITKPIESIMNQITLASLVGFLVIQGILYIICLLRLAEIRKQPISSDLKIKLLENEENMFDSGLYVGLGGTVVSLVFIAMGIKGPGLMAAYSSTLFGIIFVAILKICHLRPFRRRLILETEFKG